MKKLILKKVALVIICLTLSVAGGYGLTRIGAFLINDLDDSSDIVQYYGYTSTYQDEWYIMELTSFTARYLRGRGDYDVFWASRTVNTYFPYSEMDQNAQ